MNTKIKHKNLWGKIKAIVRGKFIALIVYIRKE